jgi:hypothetical protein
VFGKMAAKRVDQLRTLAHQQVTGPEQHCPGLLGFGLHGDEPHRRAGCRLRDSLGVGSIVLVTLHKRLHVDRRDQPHGVAELLNLTPQPWAVAQASIATRQRGWAARNGSRPSRGSFLRKAIEPSAVAPCTWNTRFAKSMPMIVASVIKGSLPRGVAADHHAGTS